VSSKTGAESHYTIKVPTECPLAVTVKNYENGENEISDTISLTQLRDSVLVTNAFRSYEYAGDMPTKHDLAESTRVCDCHINNYRKCRALGAAGLTRKGII